MSLERLRWLKMPAKVWRSTLCQQLLRGVTASVKSGDISYPRIDVCGNLTLSLRRGPMMMVVVMVCVFIFKAANSLQSRVLTMCRDIGASVRQLAEMINC